MISSFHVEKIILQGNVAGIGRLIENLLLYAYYWLFAIFILLLMQQLHHFSHFKTSLSLKIAIIVDFFTHPGCHLWEFEAFSFFFR